VWGEKGKLRNGVVSCRRGCRAFDADNHGGRGACKRCALRETRQGAGSREHRTFGLDRLELRARGRFDGIRQHAMMFAVAEATGGEAGYRAIHQRREDQRKAEQGEQQGCEGSAHRNPSIRALFIG